MIRPLVIGATLLMPVLADARGIHYGAVDHPELAACDDYEWSGQRPAARACYREILAGSAAAEIRAEAAWALDDRKQANTLFRTAAGDSPAAAHIRVRWGDLFLDTHQYSEALKLYDEARALEADQPFASVGRARALAYQYSPEARAELEALLARESLVPGARIQALLLSAHKILEADAAQDAALNLQRAETVAAAAGLPPLDIYALRAAIDALDDRSESPWVERGLALHSGFGDLHAVPAYFLTTRRRYRDAIERYRQAVAVEPQHYSAQVELGINLLRIDRPEDARRHLAIGYEGDPFNPKAVNTLRLLDKFSDFERLDYLERPDDPFAQLSLRLHRDQAGVLAPYVKRLAAASVAQFRARYRYAPTRPIVIEIYPDHEDFVVRTTGMPGLGILGATFGYVLAMDSPTAHPEPGYHWGATLWHEIAHVFTLSATRHRVPRWFSEGISVFEEWRSGPVPLIKLAPTIYEAMAADRFLPVAQLDEGFLRPQYPGQIQVSYHQAGLICVFIEERFGFDKLVAMLQQFDDGAATAAAVEKVFELTPKQFDEAFDEFLEARFGPTWNRLEEWRGTQHASLTALNGEDWDTAIAEGRRAAHLLPTFTGEGDVYRTIAMAYSKQGNRPEELDWLERYWRAGGREPATLHRLADGLHNQGNRAAAIAVLDSLNFVQPFDGELHRKLGDWYLAEGEAASALTEFEVALALAPHDLAAAHYRVARAHHELGNRDQARMHLLTALDRAPRFREAQMLLLEIARSPAG